MDTTKKLTEQLAEARAKVTELEAAVKTQAVGKLAVVKSEGQYGDVDAGDIVKVVASDGDEYQLRGELLDESDYDYFKLDQIEVLTYEGARELMIAEVDRQLSAYYPKGADE